MQNIQVVLCDHCYPYSRTKTHTHICNHLYVYITSIANNFSGVKPGGKSSLASWCHPQQYSRSCASGAQPQPFLEAAPGMAPATPNGHMASCTYQPLFMFGMFIGSIIDMRAAKTLTLDMILLLVYFYILNYIKLKVMKAILFIACHLHSLRHKERAAFFFRTTSSATEPPWLACRCLITSASWHCPSYAGGTRQVLPSIMWVRWK